MHWFICQQCHREVPESDCTPYEQTERFGPESGLYHTVETKVANNFAPTTTYDDAETLCGPVVLDDGEGDADD